MSSKNKDYSNKDISIAVQFPFLVVQYTAIFWGENFEDKVYSVKICVGDLNFD